MIAKPEDLAYLAGIIDGEGTLLVKQPNPSYFRLALVVEMTDEPVILWLFDTFGGRIQALDQRNYNAKARRLSWRWDISGRDLLELLEAVRPYVRGKLAQVDVLLMWPRESFVGSGSRIPPEVKVRQQELFERIKEVRRVGLLPHRQR